jgi:hypothetical protein
MGVLSAPLRSIIIRFDAFLSRVYRVYPFTNAEDCILRLRITEAHQAVALPCGMINVGDCVLEIHLWNEHMPILHENESSMVWGNRTLRLFLQGLRQVAQQMACDPRLSGVRAIRGEMIFLSTSSNPARGRQMERLGFTVLPYQSKAGAFGEFWENFYSWWLMWAYNPLSVRGRRLGSNRRMEIWMPVDAFTARYGIKKAELHTETNVYEN